MMDCRWKSNYQEGRVGVPLTNLTPQHFCDCPKPELDFQRHISWSFLCSLSSVKT